MDPLSAVGIFVGAGFGALARWGLGLALNPVFPTLPLGTLAANAIGGLLMGVALGFFGHFEALPPAVRLTVTTGFLGGLTTFSTFSAETTTLLLRGEWWWGAAAIAAHVGASLGATVIGIGAVRWTLSALGAHA